MNIYEVPARSIQLTTAVGECWEQACALQIWTDSSFGAHLSDAVNCGPNTGQALDDGAWRDDDRAVRAPVDAAADEADHPDEFAHQHDGGTGHLEAIPEEDPEEAHLWLAMDALFAKGIEDVDDMDLKTATQSIINSAEVVKSEFQNEEVPELMYLQHSQDEWIRDVANPLSHYVEAGLHAQAEDMYGMPHVFDESGNTYIELEFTGFMAGPNHDR